VRRSSERFFRGGSCNLKRVVGEGDVRGVHEVFDEEVEGVGEVAREEGSHVGEERNHLLGQHGVVRGLQSHQGDKGLHDESEIAARLRLSLRNLK
jgi:hypothetical protein